MSNILSGNNSDSTKHLVKVLDSVGDGSGTTNMAATTDEYFFLPGNGVVMEIRRIVIAMSDATVPTHALYGGIAALSTGCSLSVKNDSTTTIDLLDTEKLKDNTDLARHATWWNIFTATSVAMLSFVIDFGDHPIPVIGNSSTNERISYNVADDLSALLKHTVTVYGFNPGK